MNTIKRHLALALALPLAASACFVQVVETGDETGEDGGTAESGETMATDDGDPDVVCGDGTREAGELCDGDDLDDKICEDLGFGGGSLACASDCTFDVSMCEAVPGCGDGSVGEGEECDGDDLSGRTCEGLGLGGGELACNEDCTLDTSGCMNGA